MSSSVKVVVTGAAGQIAYSLIPRLVDGRTFGEIRWRKDKTNSFNSNKNAG